MPVRFGTTFSSVLALVATLTAFGAQSTVAQTPANGDCPGITGVWPPAQAVLPANTQVEVKGFYQCAGTQPGDVQLVVDNDAVPITTTTDYGVQTILEGLSPGEHVLTFKTPDGKKHTWPVTVGKQKVERLFGASRATTAISVANKLIGDWGDAWHQAPKAIVVNGDREADAIASTPLAAAMKAPILVTAGDTLTEDTRAWLAQHPGIEITVIGGEQVISPGVIQALEPLAKSVTRLGGSSRYETAKQIGDVLISYFGVNKAVVADAGRWTDALPAAVYAARTGAALVITDATANPEPVTTFVSSNPALQNNLVVAGSTITDAVVKELSGSNPIRRIDETVQVPLASQPITRDRPTSGALSVALAGLDKKDGEKSKQSLVFASATNPVDAITSGPLAAQTDGLVLADTEGSAVMSTYAQDRTNLDTQTVLVVGGPKAVAEAMVNQILGVGVHVQSPATLHMPFGDVANGQVTFTWDQPITKSAIQVHDATGKEIPGDALIQDTTLTWTPTAGVSLVNPIHATVRLEDGTYTRQTATTGDLMTPKQDANGWEIATGTGPVIGHSGRLYTWVAAVEPGTGWDIEEWTVLAEQVLNDKRGWTHNGKVRLQRVDDPATADIRLVLATPKTVDAQCALAGLYTGGRLSCWNNRNAMINLDRINQGVEHMPDLDVYRTYVISHEFGHGLGHRHITKPCVDANQLAPVMMQQSKDLRGCKPNGWPFPDAQ